MKQDQILAVDSPGQSTLFATPVRGVNSTTGPLAHSHRVLTTYEEIETLRPFWNRWQLHPNVDLDHFLLVCRLLPTVRKPYVVVIYEGNDPVSILVARIDESHVSASLGYFKGFRIPAKRLSVLY